MSIKNNIEEDIQLRSDEVHEILTAIPNWMVRWGISVIALLLISFLFLAWFIKYPDVIKGSVTLTTENPPINLVVKSSGKLENIYFPKIAKVHKGQVIATISSSLSESAKHFLRDEVKRIQNAFQAHTLKNISLKEHDYVFGELQPQYIALTTTIKEYKYLINKGNIAFNIANIKQQLQLQRNLENLIKKQITHSKQLLSNATKKFHSDKLLYKKGIISRNEYYSRQRSYQTSIDKITILNKNRISVKITITTLEKQLNDLNSDFEQKKNNLLNEINNLLSKIQNKLSTWERSYTLIAPINGKLTYLKPLDENQYVQAGQALFAIIPDNESYIAQINISKHGYGKVNVGQKVLLKFDNYPYYEYGQVIGEVISVTLIPNENRYLVYAELVDGLTTTYHKKLNYTPKMTGTALIIAEELRITERIFYQFRKIIAR